MDPATDGKIAQDCHPRVRAMIDYWLSIHPPSGLPGRQHFDPIAVPKLLSNMGLIEVHGDPPRFRCRLYGTALVAAIGRDITGQWYDEAFPDFEQAAQYGNFLHVVTTGTPHWRRGRLRIPVEQDHHLLERVHLPLASDSVNVDMILTFAIFFDPDDPFLEARGLSAPSG
jgi:hypothetical protein